jgi:cytochrome c oxidase subunit II
VRFLLAWSAILLAAAAFAPAAYGQFAPVEPNSPNAEGIRDSYLFVSIFVVAIFVLVQGLLIAFVWKYRRQRRDRFEDGVQIHGSTRLELMWTGAPVLVLIAIAIFVFVELPGITNVPDAGAGGRLEVQVTARQFYWQYEYPNGVIAIDRLRAPQGVPVRLEVEAHEDDVVHSWWIPALAGKVDAIPGTTTSTWFEARETGVFRGQCAELCGLEHASMLADVEVMTEREFDAWLDERAAAQTEGTSELGTELWDGVCAKCHGPEGEGGIGRRIGGTSVLSDAAAIEDIVRNGRGEMPAVGAGWSDEQMEALTDYLEESPPSGSSN